MKESMPRVGKMETATPVKAANENKKQSAPIKNSFESEIARVAEENAREAMAMKRRADEAEAETDRMIAAGFVATPEPITPAQSATITQEIQPAVQATTEPLPTETKTWSEHVASLSDRVGNQRDEHFETLRHYAGKYDSEYIPSLEASAPAPKSLPERVQGFVARQMQEMRINASPLVVETVRDILLQMTPQELMDVGVHSGSLENISPSDTLVRTKLLEKVAHVRNAEPRLSLWQRLFGRRGK